MPLPAVFAATGRRGYPVVIFGHNDFGDSQWGRPTAWLPPWPRQASPPVAINAEQITGSDPRIEVIVTDKSDA